MASHPLTSCHKLIMHYRDLRRRPPKGQQANAREGVKEGGKTHALEVRQDCRKRNPSLRKPHPISRRKYFSYENNPCFAIVRQKKA